MDILKEQLRAMKTAGRWNPSSSWVMREEGALMHTIRSPRQQVVSPSENGGMLERIRIVSHLFLPQSFVHAFRPAMSAALIGLLAISGWITTVSAAYNSVPGDVLYNVKLAAEKTQAAVVAVTGTGSDKAQLHLEFASRRAQEVKQVLAKKTDIEKPQAVSVAIESLEKSIAAAKDSVKEVSQKEPEQTVAVAKTVNEKSTEIVHALQEVAKDTATSNNSALAKKVVETTKLVNETGLAAVEAAVQTQSSSDTPAAQKEVKEVKELVTQQIDAIAQDSRETIASFVTTTVAVMASSSARAFVSASSSPAVASSSTLSVNASAGVTVAQTVQKAAETSVVAQGAILEAKNLVNSNQLLEALQQAKKANDATQEVKQAVADVQQAVKETGGTIAPSAGDQVATTTVGVNAVASTTKK